MSLLSDADLTYMQATQEQALPGTVVIERYTRTSDGMGGQWETWAAVGTVLGRIYPRATRGFQIEVSSGAQLTSQEEWLATLPYGTDVTAKDRLLYSGRTWEVARVNNDEMWQTAVRCEVKSSNEERRI